jgi:hypothetical protein
MKSVYVVYPRGEGEWLVHPNGWRIPWFYFRWAREDGDPGAGWVELYLQGVLEEKYVDPKEHPWIHSRIARLIGVQPEDIVVYRLC